MQFVFDIDGTLSFDRFTIDDRIKTALQDAESFGHQIAFATARSYRDSIDILGQDLSQKTVIGLNGGLAYQSGRLLVKKHMARQAFELALDYCYRYLLPYFVDDDFHYATHLGEQIPFFKSVDPLGLAQEKAIADLTYPIKMVIYFGDHLDQVASVSHELAKLDLLDISFHEDESCLYLNPKGVTKASTIQELFGHDFIAFGNDQNDIAMFKAATYSVQVGDFKALRPFADSQVTPHEVAEKIEAVFKAFQ